MSKKFWLKGSASLVLIITMFMIAGIAFIYNSGKGPGETPAIEGIWRYRAPMPTPRAHFALVAVGDKIYAIGGHNREGVLDVNEMYDPKTNKWTQKAPINFKRHGMAFAAIDGKIYVFGGKDDKHAEHEEGEEHDESSHDETGYVEITEMYDPKTDTWTIKKSILTSRECMSAGVIGNKIYTIAGHNYGQGGFVKIVEMYDTKTDTWTRKADTLFKHYCYGVAVVDNTIYAIAGAPYLSKDKIETYDSIRDEWKEISNDGFVSRSHFKTVVIGDKIYAIGGGNGLDTNQMYDPAMDMWITKTSMDTGRGHLGVVILHDKGRSKIYAIGGKNSTGYLDTNEEYFIPLDNKGKD